MTQPQDQNRIAAAFDRLFRTYPQSDRGLSPGDATVERMERAKVYFEAVAPYDVRDVEAAVQSFITGSAPGVNHAFSPSAPAIGAETRRMMNLRLEREAREKTLRPALPPPEAPHTPELRSKFKEVVDGLVASLSMDIATEEAALMERRKATLQRTNERFAPDMSPEAMARRLGYSAGDRDGDREVA